MLEDFDQTVAEFMQDFGGAGYLQIANKGVRDLDTNEIVVTYTPIEVQAIILDLTLQSNGLQVIDGTLIQSGDKRCFIRPVNKTDPTKTMPDVNPTKDKFEMSGVTYTIVTLKETNPTGTNNVMLELYLRR